MSSNGDSDGDDVREEEEEEVSFAPPFQVAVLMEFCIALQDH